MSGGGNSRVFDVNANVTVAMSGLTVTGGKLTAPTSATFPGATATGAGILTLARFR